MGLEPSLEALIQAIENNRVSECPHGRHLSKYCGICDDRELLRDRGERIQELLTHIAKLRGALYGALFGETLEPESTEQLLKETACDDWEGPDALASRRRHYNFHLTAARRKNRRLRAHIKQVLYGHRYYKEITVDWLRHLRLQAEEYRAQVRRMMIDLSIDHG